METDWPIANGGHFIASSALPPIRITQMCFCYNEGGGARDFHKIGFPRNYRFQRNLQKCFLRISRRAAPATLTKNVEPFLPLFRGGEGRGDLGSLVYISFRIFFLFVLLMIIDDY